jgi:hypothetical protein
MTLGILPASGHESGDAATVPRLARPALDQGHYVLEVKKLNATDWSILVRKV